MNCCGHTGAIWPSSWQRLVVQMLMSLAAPWPLKIILDNVVGKPRPPAWINWLLPMLGGTAKAQIAAAAGDRDGVDRGGEPAPRRMSPATSPRAWVRASETICGCGYTTSCRSFPSRYYDTNRVGTILSTLTSDVQTIQSFASTSTLNIVHRHPDRSSRWWW